MRPSETDLREVWWPGSTDTYVGMNWRVGHRGCKRIYIATDGNGSVGHYDRIHVIFEGGVHRVYPAHHAEGWEFLEQAKGAAA